MKIALATLAAALLAFLFWGIYSSQQTGSVNDPFPESITEAFGIPLGKPFDPGMVAEVLGKEQKMYTVKEGVKSLGTVIKFKPKVPDELFQSYVIKTTPAGIIYSVEGKYQDSKMTPPACKEAIKSLAKEMEARYGKPRGKGSFGQWFSFRQTTDNSSKSLRLYAHRCRTGAYSIVYTDEKVRKES